MVLAKIFVSKKPIYLSVHGRFTFFYQHDHEAVQKALSKSLRTTFTLEILDTADITADTITLAKHSIS